MSEKLIDPARPPLPTAWNFPFQFSVGNQTSKLIAGDMTPTTRHMGTAMVPTGAGFAPAARTSATVILVRGSSRFLNVATVHGAVTAADSGASMGIADRAAATTMKKKRDFINYPPCSVGAH